MPEVRFTTEAESDLDEIAEYTIGAWGPEQADRYLTNLEEGFSLLAANPSLGRPCDSLHPGLRRFEIERHGAFCISEPHSVLIVRVLHRTMLPRNILESN